MSEKLASARRISCLVRDYAELTKARITALIVLTAWCGYFFGAHKSGISAWSAGLFHALLGVALVSSGTAALNEVLECDVDSRMRRTAQRPLPAGRMSRRQAAIAGLLLTTECLVTEIPEKEKKAPMPGGHGGGMGEMDY